MALNCLFCADVPLRNYSLILASKWEREKEVKRGGKRKKVFCFSWNKFLGMGWLFIANAYEKYSS